ncbi:MAG: response regulator transcription factor [Leptospirillia bacterium]
MTSKTETSAIIFVVDDDVAVRDSLSALLETKGFRVMGFASADDFLAAYDPEWVGCLILDVRMPGMNGPDLQNELERRGCSLPIVFLSGHANIPTAVRTMQGGAVDFVEKPGNNVDLLKAIRKALERNAREQTKHHRQNTLKRRIATLTPREHEVMERMVEGLPTKLIADRLGISPKTVDIHRGRVMRKMQADSLAKLLHMVLG